jgi:agmatine deiminase
VPPKKRDHPLNNKDKRSNKLGTPREEGFYMPAEWHPHAATWMSWASLQKTYIDAPQGPESAFDMAKKAYSEVAKAIARFEPVSMITNKADIEEVKQLCGPDIHVFEAEIDDGWFRDSGPSFLISHKGEIAGVNWVFNGYGNKYTHENDAKIAKTILNREGIKCFDCPLVTEGGAIHVDGLACFIRPGTVMASVTPNKNHPDYDVLQENLEILKNSTDAKGRPLKILEVNNPSQFTEEGMIFTGLYLNHYIANGAVILPLSGFTEDDAEALKLFKREFPNHEVVQVPSQIVWFGGGNVHCITQQQPRSDVTT